MDYGKFNDAMAHAKSIGDDGSYAEAQRHYQILLRKKLDINQYATVSIGRASCFLRAADADSAAKVLDEICLEGLDETVQAVIHNVKAHAFHELGNYEKAIAAGQNAQKIASKLGAGGLDVLGEALSRQGFAEAELGRLTEASEHLAMARRMPVDESISRSISLYTEQFHLNYPRFL
ncbi:tetratricopeptide repeat protein [Granulicella arctica]|uniref:Tetratricopeptide (TPR) repeat protein n=1 Tax=Granulicella arctica TaxID=940613 RepID=A0A7Y9PHK7_9BACT|nr:tetratricopeptide repeat protein [Granulicella arctica]NYF79890.1 tetratricopeptide (TPR) repeat protein [Granulicella arctica]